jgi:aromatic-L-amino-acid decarboxylase
MQWGLVNFDCSTLWVRDRTHLTNALDVTPEFLRTTHGDAGTVIDYRNWHLALGRRFRALKVWFVLRSYGVHGFQAHIQRVRLLPPLNSDCAYTAIIDRCAK